MYELENMVVEALNPLLKNKGFIWSKSGEMYIRKKPWGFHCLLWSCHETGPAGTLELGLVIGVRHNDVDNMVNGLGIIYGEDNKKYTTTVCRSLVLFPFEGVDAVHLIRGASAQADIKDFFDKVQKIVEGVGDVFYQNYSTIMECSRGLNAPVDVISHQLCNNFPNRVYYGLACALLAEPDRVPQLVREYIEFATVSKIVDVGKITDRVYKLLSLAGWDDLRCQAAISL